MIRISIASSMLLMFVAASAGCVNDQSDSPVLILYNKAPGDMCTITGADTGVGIARGFIDAQSWGGYIFTPIVKNFAATTSAVSMEQRLAFLQGADVRLTLDENVFSAADRSAFESAGLTSFSMGFSGVVDPDGGTASLAFEIIPAELLAEMRTILAVGSQRTGVQASIDLFGTMAGGEFQSQTFQYWVDVCNGCTMNNLGSCADLNGTVYNQGGTCNPLQDTSIVDCCTDDAGGTICPAVVSPSQQL